jgi:hypothetical protein
MNPARSVCPTFWTIQILEAYDDTFDASIHAPDRRREPRRNQLLKARTEHILAVDGNVLFEAVFGPLFGENPF